jgi:leucyl/phenylalanyl-tRNA--protein transferase
MIADRASRGKAAFAGRGAPAIPLDRDRGSPHHRPMSRPAQSVEITADILLRAYSIGLFPMAESSDSTTLFWVDPKERGVFPLDGLIVSKSLVRTLRSDRFEVCADGCFDAVVAACANREKTWINAEIRRLYRELFEAGRAHSVEVFEDGALVGGLYGVSLAGAFFGESMFHLARDASKVALAHLVARLRLGGYRLLDTQFVTPHLASLGAMEVTRDAYLQMLGQALSIEADFDAWPASRPMSGEEVLGHLGR